MVMGRGWGYKIYEFNVFLGLTNIPLTQSPMQARTEAAINHVKNEQGKIRSQQLAFETGLLDPEMMFRSIGFTNFLSTWLVRQVDPKKTHPNPLVEYVLIFFLEIKILF